MAVFSVSLEGALPALTFSQPASAPEAVPCPPTSVWPFCLAWLPVLADNNQLQPHHGCVVGLAARWRRVQGLLSLLFCVRPQLFPAPSLLQHISKVGILTQPVFILCLSDGSQTRFLKCFVPQAVLICQCVLGRCSFGFLDPVNSRLMRCGM